MYGHIVRDSIHKEIARLLIGRLHRKAVNLKEDFRTDPRDALVTVDEWLVLCQATA